MIDNARSAAAALIVPAISAALGFVLLIVHSISTGHDHRRHLSHMEDGYLPALTLGGDMAEAVRSIHEELGAAAAARDESALVGVANHRRRVRFRLRAARDNPIRNAEEVDAWITDFEAYYEAAVETARQIARRRVSRVVSDPWPADLARSVDAMNAEYDALRRTYAALDESDRSGLKAALIDARDDNAAATRTATGVTVLFLLILAVLATTAVRVFLGIAGDIERMTGAARALAGGDLGCAPLGAHGSRELAELRRAIDAIADALRTQVGAIRDASSDVYGRSTGFTAATAQLASAADEQASAIAEITATVEDTRHSGLAAKESADEIVASSERSVAVSAEDLEAIENTVAELWANREQVEAIAAGIEVLRAQIGEVGEIITTVNEIAEQSNLLAVNTSIEAAKAGESGRGFAVVALEVKSLAEQSKDATTQVRSTLGSIRHAIEDVYTAANTGRQTTEAGVKSMEDTGAVIERLGQIITTTAEAAQRIAASSNAQVSGLARVCGAISDINESATDNLAGARELEAGGSKLAATAKELERLVAHYELGGPDS